MTVHEFRTTEIGSTKGPRTALLDDLGNGTPFFVAFGGQGSRWLATLSEISQDYGLDAALADIVDYSSRLLEPVSAELIPYAPNHFQPTRWMQMQREDAAPSDETLSAPEMSVPGILLAQIATIHAMSAAGLDASRFPDMRVIGHSQGCWGAAAWINDDHAALLASIRITVAAVVKAARTCGLVGKGERAPMVSVSNVDPERLRSILAEINAETMELPVVLSIINSRRRVVLSGTHTQLDRVRRRCAEITAAETELRAAKTTGGAVFDPRFDALPIRIGFHHPALRIALDDVRAWSERCGLDADRAVELARRTAVDPVDWVEELESATLPGGAWMLDVGPDDTLARLSRSTLAGTGVAIVSVSTRAGQRELLTPGAAPEAQTPWKCYAPSLVKLPHGPVVVETLFTRLTGRSPILLAGMTPTTVDTEIVAAAANGGYWAELAGGGQVTEAMLSQRISELGSKLEPGRAVQFNSMFLDPYLWKMQVGGKKMVPRARAAGAAIDGIVVTAGIPEFDEALALIAELRSTGIEYVCFKPGTVAQIGAVVRIAKAAVGEQIIVHVEGGRAGGHHSWEDLDDLLIATYQQLRSVPGIVLCVGGGIGTPERAADYLTGHWSVQLGYPAMPVDGILVGTAAMAVLEATTTPDVKRLLMATPGSDAWIGAGGVDGGMSSGRSQLGADIHEIDNSASRCGRLLDEVAGNADAVQARRDEIIAALDATAKPYFGDVETMTYRQWLDRYVEIAGRPEAGRGMAGRPEAGRGMAGRPEGWVDVSWRTRFVEFVNRAEARLHPADSGTAPSIFPDDTFADSPRSAIGALTAAYPHATDTVLHPADVAFFLAQCRTPGKPVNFVPVVDGDVRRWWRSDSLWQAHDPRYPADAVCVIPGPQSVAGIDRVDEPVAELLARFENAAVDRLLHAGRTAVAVAGRRRDDRLDGPLSVVLAAETVVWADRHIINPILQLGIPSQWELTDDGAMALYETDSDRPLATLTELGSSTVELSVRIAGNRSVSIVITVPPSTEDGGVPVVEARDALDAMREILTIAAGSDLPDVVDGVCYSTVAWMPGMSSGHTAVTAAGLPDHLHATDEPVPDVLMGACWPTVFAVLGSATTESGIHVLEGMLDLVHLEHVVDVHASLPKSSSALLVRAELKSVSDTESGRVVEISVTVQGTGAEDLGVGDIAAMTERFAIRGRIGDAPVPVSPVLLGQALSRPTPRKRRAEATLTTPDSMEAFAAVSSDHNPIHTSSAAAALAGLDGPIVHGMWLSAAAQHVVMSSANTESLAGWSVQFLAPVLPGQKVDVTVDRIATASGSDVVEVSCKVDGNPVMSATAVHTAPVTAYAFPGQGIQHQGMGQKASATSVAARKVWDRADAIARARLGFSILTVVRDNPQSLTVGDRVFHHPDGVLFLTQFTQVAMAALGVAQMARMHEAGVVAADYSFCGHSVGEFTALAAAGDVLDLEQVLELVYARGSIMSDLVERDSLGRSPFAMGAVRPDQMGMDHADLAAFVGEVAASTGEFLEVVNYNLRGSQYTVAGTTAGLAALGEECNERREAFGGRKAFILVPGIDTPFHSSVLRDGVDQFRMVLDRILPDVVDPAALVGRYVPNLVARTFTLDREFAEAVAEKAPSAQMNSLIDNFDALDHGTLTRTMLIELLAWQLASPVRWIETQDLLFGELGIERFIEVGVANSPTLSNLATSTLKQGSISARVLNVERDEAIVMSTDMDDAEADEVRSSSPQPEYVPIPETVATPVAPVAPQPAPVHTSGERPSDITFGAVDALRVLIAVWTKTRLDQLGAADTVETLCEGVSSRRNQLMLDLTSELSIGAIDGGADLDLTALGETASRMAGRYSAFGPVLTDTLEDMLRRTFGPSGRRPNHVGERVSGTWQLGDGWVSHVRAELALGTRDGVSLRGGALATLHDGQLTDPAAVDTAVDAAVQAVASRMGVAVALPSTGASTGAQVDSGALTELSDSILGADGVLATTARGILEQLGLTEPVAVEQATDDELRALVDAELGADWPRVMAPAFDAGRAVLMDDRWATVREDLAAMWLSTSRPASGLLAGSNDIEADRFTGAGQAVAAQARWWATRTQDPELNTRYTAIADAAEQPRVDTWASDIAVVTGASRGSIASAVVANLLAGGATVVATTSRLDSGRLAFYRDLYRDNAAVGAALWVVPANIASYSDVDALASWIAAMQQETLGGKTVVTKEALRPTLLFPFAAPSVSGDLSDVGGRAEAEMRVLLWSVERMIATLSTIGADTATGGKLHVVLPGSPNRGLFGGDGAYGEAKASLDALTRRWHAEKSWSRRVTLVHALIGWVSGTGLMGHNDGLAASAREHGVSVFTPAEMAELLLSTCTAETRLDAVTAPLDIDFSGGLGSAGLDFGALMAETVDIDDTEDNTRTVRALPPAPRPKAIDFDPTWPVSAARPEDLIVIVGAGEVGSYGSSRTRFEVEVHDRLSAAGVVELAWNTGLIEWRADPKAGWYDRESGDPVDEADIADRYHDAVMSRAGIRVFPDNQGMKDNALPLLTSVYLDKDLSFVVGSRAEATAFVEADPEHTVIAECDGEWTVTRRAGTEIRVPRTMKMTRTVGAPLPDGFDPVRWGIPADMVDALDPVAVWNIVATVDAFLSSGFTPAELLSWVHPRFVANTQGTGQGAQAAIHAAYVQTLLGEPIANDILQETLPNVVAAHVVQSYVGGYGAMVNPVGACASAAVSVEEGVDKIRLGKATLVVAGGFDDAGPQSILGFSNMSATADSTALEAKGIDRRRFSRANDRRRAGFVEAQGGGTVLLARGDLALAMGLPVLGVIAWAGSFADGVHTSIPAPGIGALSAGIGGSDSELAVALSKIGLHADDIAVVSKHDTSTRANDPNEAELHERLADAIGRTEGAPLLVVSQKSLIGHGKGGAAAFQIIGLCQVLDSGVVPPNRSLDCVDDEMAKFPHLVWPKRPLEFGETYRLRAGVLTSLGFGHVSGLVVVAHADAFLASLTEEQRERYIEQATMRRHDGERRILSAMCGGPALYERPAGRRFGDGDDAHQREVDMLLDASSRLGVDGEY